MAFIAQSPQSSRQPGAPRRIWHAPISRTCWLWLIVSILLVSLLGIIYLVALKTQLFPGPLNDPLRSFGIIAFLLFLGTAAYSLRRRFARGLPGKVQSWLWMHTWLGCAALLVALLHENFAHVLYDYCSNVNCLTNAYGGTTALLALALLVLVGIAGRLIDLWQTRLIAREASTNGVGIVRALEEQMLELEYTLERLSAGKSEIFKHYFIQALDAYRVAPDPMGLPQAERADFSRAQGSLQTYVYLARSLARQRKARRFIRVWRRVHIILAILAILIITFHATMELLINVFHLVKL